MVYKIPAWLDTPHSNQNSADNHSVDIGVFVNETENNSSLTKKLSDSQQKSFDLNDILTANYNNNQWQHD